jgi:hypothetical protein
MTPELLGAARATAHLINTRINVVIPSILAEGEPFAARVSITGSDALPVDASDITLHFEECVGIVGLPASFRAAAGESTGRIEGLTAVGPDTALIRMRVEWASCKATISSNPAWVFKNPAYRLFFGDTHVHTEFSNCSGWRCLSPDWCYEYAREISLLDFVAPADHLRGIASEPRRWQQLQASARRHNAPGDFVSFLAFESSHAQGFGGDNNVYFLEDDAPYFWLDREDMRGISPQVRLRELWRFLDESGKTYFTAPHHTGRAAKYRAWDEDCHDPAREPLFEIYSSWGSSEMRHTRLPISGGNNDAPSYFVDALKAGAQFGLIASSDDHATLPGSTHHFRVDAFRAPTLNGHAHKGLAAVRAAGLARSDLFDAMRRRETYATTDARTLVDITIGDATMGMAVPADQRLREQRTVKVRFTLDGAPSARVILMRNGEALDSRSVRGSDLMTAANEVEFVDAEPLERVTVRDAKYHPAPFAVYYARVEDGNGAHQWTSPIWIDLE